MRGIDADLVPRIQPGDHDGRVLVAGRDHPSPGRTDPSPPTAEIFDPSLIP